MSVRHKVRCRQRGELKVKLVDFYNGGSLAYSRCSWWPFGNWRVMICGKSLSVFPVIPYLHLLPLPLSEARFEESDHKTIRDLRLNKKWMAEVRIVKWTTQLTRTVLVVITSYYNALHYLFRVHLRRSMGPKTIHMSPSPFSLSSAGNAALVSLYPMNDTKRRKRCN